MEEPSDQELVQLALIGSEDGYRQLVRRFQRPVLSLLVRMVGDPGLAEELAQDAFVKAFRALGSYDRSRRFASWLFKIAHNTAIDHLRRGSLTTVPLETPDPERPDLAAVLFDEGRAKPDEVAEQREQVRHLEEALADLEPVYREAILLRFAEGLAYEEIAEILEVPLGTVKTRLHRARKQLAAALEGRGWGRSQR